MPLKFIKRISYDFEQTTENCVSVVLFFQIQTQQKYVDVSHIFIEKTILTIDVGYFLVSIKFVTVDL